MRHPRAAAIIIPFANDEEMLAIKSGRGLLKDTTRYIQGWDRVVDRLGELASRGQREPGGGIQAI